MASHDGPQDPRTYRQLVERCKELKPHSGPCKGTRNDILGRVLAAERRLDASEITKPSVSSKKKQKVEDRKDQNNDQKDEPSLSLLDLPSEIILNEIYSRMSVADLIALSSTSTSYKTFNEASSALKNRLISLDYKDLQEAVLDWSYRGVMLPLLYELLPLVMDRLDLITVAYVYYYAMEREEWDEVLMIRRTVKERYGPQGDQKRAKLIEGLFSVTRRTYTALKSLIGSIKRKSSKQTLAKHESAILKSIEGYGNLANLSAHAVYEPVLAYIYDLLIANLSDELLLSYMRTEWLPYSFTGTYIIKALYRAERLGLLLRIGSFDSVKKWVDDNMGENAYKRYSTFLDRSKKARALHMLDNAFIFPEGDFYRYTTPQEVYDRLKALNRLESYSINAVRDNALKYGYTVWTDLFDELVAADI